MVHASGASTLSSGRSGPGLSRWTLLAVAGLTTLLSVGFFLYFYDREMTNVYGDGIAHTNIARKVVDHLDESRWQRYIQIGSPWLPLQTVMMLPFVANDSLWRTGIAGSVVSMLSFLVAAVVLYLYASRLYKDETGLFQRALPLVSVLVFAFNPNILYMQSSPMTEALFIASLATAAYLLQRWVDSQTTSRLSLAGIAMALATLCRYEAWPVAAAAGGIVLIACRGRAIEKIRTAGLYAAIASTGPGYWLWHNWAVYGDALWFLRGPHSARALYLRNEATLGWARVFVGNALLDLLLMVVTVAVCAGPVVVALGLLGTGRFMISRKRLLAHAPALLLFVPFLFHVLSLYLGEIQVFPFSAFGLLNVRYGIPHVLALSLFLPAAALLPKRVGQKYTLTIVCTLVLFQYGYLISEGVRQLEVYQEGFRNGVNARGARQKAKTAEFLRENAPRPLILMHTGSLGPLVPSGGLRFSNIVHEGTVRWHSIESDQMKEIRTVIFEDDDSLDRIIRGSPLINQIIRRDFEKKFEIGTIKVYVRKQVEGQ